ncbi:hypothetical protein [Herminiimonas arsenitoxidans]|nr:hypothetical protein [Herminiimonas arsenitoxidans]
MPKTRDFTRVGLPTLDYAKNARWNVRFGAFGRFLLRAAVAIKPT